MNSADAIEDDPAATHEVRILEEETLLTAHRPKNPASNFEVVHTTTPTARLNVHLKAMATVDRSKIAAAAEQNVRRMRKNEPARLLYTAFDGEYELRQRFRKRIDREVLELNAPKLALQSLQVVAKLAENILADPNNLTFRKVKMDNVRIKKLVVEPKGAVQLLVDMGFREQVEDFVPHYVFRKKNMNELRIGASMIKEAIAREAKRQEDEELKNAREAAELAAHMEKIHLQFMDDRLSVAARAQRERHSGYQEKGIPRREGPGDGSNIVTLRG